jgi:hypothetical protein
MLLRNVRLLSTDYTVLYPKTQTLHNHCRENRSVGFIFSSPVKLLSLIRSMNLRVHLCGLFMCYALL